MSFESSNEGQLVCWATETVVVGMMGGPVVFHAGLEGGLAG